MSAETASKKLTRIGARIRTCKTARLEKDIKKKL
jgi:hypothetical protein